MKIVCASLSLLFLSAVSHASHGQSTQDTAASPSLSAGRKLLHSVACGAPAGPAAATGIGPGHCEKLRKLVKNYRQRWLSKATPLFSRVVPHATPGVVVYPFGGGDLLTARAVFPKLSEITTISLEPAGDATSIDRLTPQTPRRAIAQLRSEMGFLLRSNFSRTRHATCTSS